MEKDAVAGRRSTIRVCVRISHVGDYDLDDRFEDLEVTIKVPKALIKVDGIELAQAIKAALVNTADPKRPLLE